MELLHWPGGRALAHSTGHVTALLLWWSLIALAVVGIAIFVALLGMVLWGIFIGPPEITPG